MSGKADNRVVVIGGGPAGLFAAVSAAESGARVTLLEKAAQLGRKLCASGGGRGNVTNALPEEDFLERFGRNGRFAAPALRALSRDSLLDLLARWGVPCHAPDGFHYFPASDRAKDVLNAICRRLEAVHVDVRCRTDVTGLVIRDGRICGVLHEQTRTARRPSLRCDVEGGPASVRAGSTGLGSSGRIPADAVILAAGGAAYPALGGSESGYELARQAGHAVVPVVPGLAGLRTREKWPSACAGVTIEDTEVKILHRSCAKRAWRGALLFTHGGLSGPAVLDASASAARVLLEETEVTLEFRPTGGEPGHLERLFAGWRRERGRKLVRNLVGELVPSSLAAAVCGICGVAPDTIMARLPEHARKQLVAALDRLAVHVTATEGFEQAMVTSGGVSLKEVNPATLESKVLPGLLFAGEILDLDGPCGGFNLQWCFSSGWLAGLSAAGTDHNCGN